MPVFPSWARIAENAATDGGVVVARMLASQDNTGFDAARKVYVDLVAAGMWIRSKWCEPPSKIGFRGKRTAAHGSNDDGDSRAEARLTARNGDGRLIRGGRSTSSRGTHGSIVRGGMEVDKLAVLSSDVA